MRIRLTYAWQRWTLLAIVMLGCGGYSWLTGRTLLAARAAASADRARVLHASELEPRNATHFYRLARHALAEDLDPVKAAGFFERAVALDPYTSNYWLDLALAYNSAGDVPRMRVAIEHALAVDPKTPETLWRAANLLILAGDNERAFTVLRELIGPRPEYAADAIDLAWRATRDPELVLGKVVPPQPAAQFAFLAKMAQEKQPQAADRAWKAILDSGAPFEAKDAFPYIEYLLAQNEGVKARQAWNDIAKVDGSFAPYVSDSSLLVNGSFELPVLARALGWRHEPRAGVALEITTDTPHSGNHALAIEFDTGELGAGITQWVPVAPNGLYAVKAFYKGELEGVNLPRLEVTSANGERLMLSEEMRAHKDWEELRGVFSTNAEQSVVLVKVVRAPVNARLRGRLLLDDLSIVREK
jgi:hypothetical protein